MRILRSTDYRRMPWKNGGGFTREVAVSPAGATFETLDWRVSLAAVVEDGPFSLFNGMDRTLCVTRGAGIRLQTNAESPIALYETSEPYSFDGEATTNARLIDGPIEDLSVMSRRGCFRHHVRRIAFTDAVELGTQAQPFIIYCQRGDLTCVSHLESAQLHADDAVIFEHAAEPIRLIPVNAAEIHAIEFHREFPRHGTR